METEGTRVKKGMNKTRKQTKEGVNIGEHALKGQKIKRINSIQQPFKKKKSIIPNKFDGSLVYHRCRVSSSQRCSMKHYKNIKDEDFFVRSTILDSKLFPQGIIGSRPSFPSISRQSEIRQSKSSKGNSVTPEGSYYYGSGIREKNKYNNRTNGSRMISNKHKFSQVLMQTDSRKHL